MQAHVDAKYRRGSIIAALVLYSDASTLSNDMRTHGWPLVFTLANIAMERRNEPGGHALAALFPILHAVPGHPGGLYGLLVWRKCTEVLESSPSTARRFRIVLQV